MAQLKQHEFEDHIDSYAKIDLAIRCLADEYANKFDSGSHVTDIEVEYDGVFGTIAISTETYSPCSCCGSDYGEFTIPLRYLYEDDWAEQVQAELDKKQRIREEVKREKAAEQKKREAEGERKLYEKLKEKYK